MKIQTYIQPDFTTTGKTNVFWAYVLFFLWPLFAVVQSFRNLSQPYSRAIITMFFGLFGFNLVYNASHDSSRHAQSFREIVDRPFSDFFEIVTGLYSDQEMKPDFVMDLIGFIVSRFTSNSSILFLVLGLILGWITVKNLKILHELYSARKNVIGLIFLIFFLIVLGPGRVLSFRHYLALGVYVYGVYQYIKGDNKFYLFIIASTIFIHFSFLMAVPLFFLYRIIGNRNIIYYILIIASFAFSDIAVTLLRDFGMDTDTSLDRVVKGYTYDKYLVKSSGMRQQQNILLKIYMSWTTMFLMGSLLWHKWKYKTFDPVSEKLYSFTLLFFSFVNFMSGMESISGRFGILFQVLCCFFYIHLYSLNKIKTNGVFKYVTLAILALNVIIMLRLTIQFMNFNSVVPFLPLSLFVESDMSLLDMIK